MDETTRFTAQLRTFSLIAVMSALAVDWQIAGFLRTYCAGTFVNIAEGLDRQDIALAARWAPFVLGFVPAVPGLVALLLLTSPSGSPREGLGRFLGLLSLALTGLLVLTSFAAVMGAILAPNIVRMWKP